VLYVSMFKMSLGTMNDNGYWIVDAIMAGFCQKERVVTVDLDILGLYFLVFAWDNK
jgi:hypothetical protein